MPKLHETVMGKSFFEGKVPRIADALEDIAKQLERLGDAADRNEGKLKASPPLLSDLSDEEVDALLEEEDEEDEREGNWFIYLMEETGFATRVLHWDDRCGRVASVKPDNRGAEYGEWSCGEFCEDIGYMDSILVKKDTCSDGKHDFEMIIPREDFKAWASATT